MAPKSAWVPIGLGTLGFTLGLTSGMSMSSGTTSAVVVAFIGFAAGGLASLTSQQLWTKNKEGELEAKPRLDPEAAGKGITIASFALLVGVFLGMTFRYEDPFGWAPPPAEAAPAAGAKGATPQSGRIGLHGGTAASSACQRATRRLSTTGDRYADACPMAVEDLESLVSHLQCDE